MSNGALSPIDPRDTDTSHIGCMGTAGPSRRGFLRLVGAGAVVGFAGGFLTRVADAATGDLALLLSCMDYRLTSATTHYMSDVLHLKNEYDHLVLAGASLGAQTDKFPAWGTTFWEHFDIALTLHPTIKRVVLLDHRDCGAYKAIFGIDYAKNPPLEYKVHAEQLHKLKSSILAKNATLKVDLGLMNLHGHVERVA